MFTSEAFKLKTSPLHSSCKILEAKVERHLGYKVSPPFLEGWRCLARRLLADLDLEIVVDAENIQWLTMNQGVVIPLC